MNPLDSAVLPAARPTEPRFMASTPAIGTVEIGPIFVALWRGAVIRESFDVQSAGLTEVVRAHPAGAAFLCVIEVTSKAPNDELRRASIEMVEAHGPRLRCLAVVIEGEGFRAAVNRGVITGLILFARHIHCPVSVFSDVRDAAAWMQKHLALPPVEDVAAAVEAVRARLPPLRD